MKIHFTTIISLKCYYTNRSDSKKLGISVSERFLEISVNLTRRSVYKLFPSFLEV